MRYAELFLSRNLFDEVGHSEIPGHEESPDCQARLPAQVDSLDIGAFQVFVRHIF